MIRLKSIDPAYAKDLFDLFSIDPQIKNLDLPLSSMSTFEKWINELLAHELLGFGVARVILSAEKQIVGLILLTNMDREVGHAEMGTWIGLPYRRSGINQKAKELMLSYAFHELGLKVIYLYTAESNLASIKALDKLSYVSLPDQTRFESELKHRKFLHGRAFRVYEIHKYRFAERKE